MQPPAMSNTATATTTTSLHLRAASSTTSAARATERDSALASNSSTLAANFMRYSPTSTGHLDSLCNENCFSVFCTLVFS